jgi:hypothetical protein
MANFLNVTVKKTTAKAILVTMIDKTDHWVPRSQITDNSEVRDLGDSGVLRTNKWWAETAGVSHLAERTEAPLPLDLDQVLPPHKTCPTCGQPVRDNFN